MCYKSQQDDDDHDVAQGDALGTTVVTARSEDGLGENWTLLVPLLTAAAYILSGFPLSS